MPISKTMLYNREQQLAGLARDVEMHKELNRGIHIGTNIPFDYWYYTEPDADYPEGRLLHFDRYVERMEKVNGRLRDKYASRPGCREVTPTEAIEISNRQWAAHEERVARADRLKAAQAEGAVRRADAEIAAFTTEKSTDGTRGRKAQQ